MVSSAQMTTGRFSKYLICLVLVSLTGLNSINGQRQTAHWYFGDRAGLLFTEAGPISLTDGHLSTIEGCSAISDFSGNLLFYTDGTTVYNRNHREMPGGRGLNGTSSSTQSALIIPQPDNDSIYYIFTVDRNGGTKGLRYSTVDLNLRGGLGDVTERNIALHTPTTEKLTAVHHANGKDVWVITHRWNSDEFVVYKVSSEGLVDEPVISKVGAEHSGGTFQRDTNALGQMKVSPNGKKLALTITDDKKVEIFSFSRQTGAISDPVSFQLAPRDPFYIYGLEFSPDSKQLYIAEHSFFVSPLNGDRILQYDISDFPDHIQSSEYTLGGLTDVGGLQLAPDNRIYIAQGGVSSLAVITKPNFRGEQAGLVPAAVDLGGRNSKQGLPGFVQSYLVEPSELIMPNIFTPNGDGHNDTFKPQTVININQIFLRIVNRWGKEVYSSDNLESFVTGWPGAGFSSGVYYWSLNYEGYDGQTNFQKGWVNLRR